MKKLWWEQVPNARKFISEIINFAVDDKNVLLDVPASIPWYDEMQSQIEEGIREQKTGYNLEVLLDDNREPGEIVMRKFCKPEKIQKYRPLIGYAKFLAESDDIVLNTRIVWITGINPDRYTSWAKFANDYKEALPEGRRGCTFILELNSANSIGAMKGINIVSYKRLIGYFDCFVFYAVAAAIINETAVLKQYLTELVTEVCGNDIELGAECLLLENYIEFLNNPINVLKKLEVEKARSDGIDFKINAAENEIVQCVWNAQIKTIFPIIENFRRCFVEKHSEAIQKELPITNSYGEERTQPNEVEIGTLEYMVCEKGITIPVEEHNKLHIYKQARNDLAHLKTLELEKIKEIVRVI